MLAAVLAASALFVPVAGDRYEYEVSSGERVTLEVVRVEPRAEQLVATVRESRLLPDGVRDEATFDLIRTATALAVDMPPPGDNARLSPLVYFFAPASVQDRWLAQSGAFLDPAGSTVQYRIEARLEAIETVSGPAGIFPDCRRITYASTLHVGLQADRVPRVTVWLHPEVGIVRTRSVTGATVQATELLRFRKH